jgi:hypothetical protein
VTDKIAHVQVFHERDELKDMLEAFARESGAINDTHSGEWAEKIMMAGFRKSDAAR